MKDTRRVGRPDKYVNIVCIETGTVFPNITTAAKVLNAHRSNVYRTILGAQRTCRGVHLIVDK